MTNLVVFTFWFLCVWCVFWSVMNRFWISGNQVDTPALKAWSCPSPTCPEKTTLNDAQIETPTKSKHPFFLWPLQICEKVKVRIIKKLPKPICGQVYFRWWRCEVELMNMAFNGEGLPSASSGLLRNCMVWYLLVFIKLGHERWGLHATKHTCVLPQMLQISTQRSSSFLDNKRATKLLKNDLHKKNSRGPLWYFSSNCSTWSRNKYCALVLLLLD